MLIKSKNWTMIMQNAIVKNIPEAYEGQQITNSINL